MRRSGHNIFRALAVSLNLRKILGYVASFTETVDSVEHSLPRHSCGVFLEWRVQTVGQRTHTLGNRVDACSGARLWQSLQCCAKGHTSILEILVW